MRPGGAAAPTARRSLSAPLESQRPLSSGRRAKSRLAAHSGGIALAWHGLQDLPPCRGLWALGADGVAVEACRGEHWRGPAVLSYNRGDAVRQENQRNLTSLARRSVVRVVDVGTAAHGHDLHAYVESGAFGLLIDDAVATTRRFVSKPAPGVGTSLHAVTAELVAGAIADDSSVYHVLATAP